MAAPLLGKGYMAFTVDQGAYTERYQGIVELKDGTLSESVQNYFRNSEQIATGIRTAIVYEDGHWRAGGILIQHVPEEGGIAGSSEGDEDGWRRTMLLLQSCTNAELTDSELSTNDVLYRLFHEEGITVQPVQHLRKGCRCTPERLEGILAGMPEEDRKDMAVNGVITMNCAFCSRDFIFDPI
jgi:molecular chaperone Hsp33